MLLFNDVLLVLNGIHACLAGDFVNQLDYAYFPENLLVNIFRTLYITWTMPFN
jgi:hypothetical protein